VNFDRFVRLESKHFAFWKLVDGGAVYRLNEPYRSMVTGCAYLIEPQGYEWVLRFTAKDAWTFYRDVLGYEEKLRIERRLYTDEWSKIEPWVADQPDDRKPYMAADGSAVTLFFKTKAAATRFQIECL
jgi:hypothetical protein